MNVMKEARVAARGAGGRDSLSGLLGALVVLAMLASFVIYFIVAVGDLAPRSRLYPQVIGAMLLALILVEMIQVVRHWMGHQSAEDTVEGRPAWPSKYTYWAIVLATVFLLLIWNVSFYVALALYAPVSMFVAGERRWWVMVLSTASYIACFYALFQLALSVRLQ